VLKKKDYWFDLPLDLIAKHPAKERTHSRLMCMDRQTGEVAHKQFIDIIDLLSPNDLLIFNDTRVMQARFFAKKITGGKLELMTERILSSHQLLVKIKPSRSVKVGSHINLTASDKDKICLKILSRQGEFFVVETPQNLDAAGLLKSYGSIPLPPYIDRDINALDNERYQTIYSNQLGAVAAPTAGLHFDEPLLKQLRKKNIQLGFLTLHVGSGTFQPVRTDNITDHLLHEEQLILSQDLCDAITKTKAKGGRVVAVGTTVVRSLEALMQQQGQLSAYQGMINCFIYPGFKFKVIDALLTNFHLPESTLLMLVSAFSHHKATMQAYEEAVNNNYRFFSYGDAMWIA